MRIALDELGKNLSGRFLAPGFVMNKTNLQHRMTAFGAVGKIDKQSFKSLQGRIIFTVNIIGFPQPILGVISKPSIGIVFQKTLQGIGSRIKLTSLE